MVEHIKNFRDALAHRIPLYIPPYVVKTSNAHEVTRLDQEANAAFSRGDLAEYNRLIDEQRKLGEFRPWMTHSFYEQAPHIVFHPQLISDYGTVDELGTNMLEALQAP